MSRAIQRDAGVSKLFFFRVSRALQRDTGVSKLFFVFSGCLGPYSGTQVVLGDPVFRQYLVVHDLRPQA